MEYWIGLEFGIDQFGLDWIGLDRLDWLLHWIDLDCTGLNYPVGLGYRTRLGWIGLDWSALEWIVLDSMDWIGLLYKFGLD